jgi:hypothetical protein
MTAVGRRVWAIPGGHVPLISSGHEPEDTSRDELAFLNTGDAEATVAVTMFYADRDPVGPYRLTVPARRVRRVRINDLIDPEAVPLGTDYGALIESDVPIVVQFSRLDTGRAEQATLGVMAFAVDR